MFLCLAEVSKDNMTKSMNRVSLLKPAMMEFVEEKQFESCTMRRQKKYMKQTEILYFHFSQSIKEQLLSNVFVSLIDRGIRWTRCRGCKM